MAKSTKKKFLSLLHLLILLVLFCCLTSCGNNEGSTDIDANSRVVTLQMESPTTTGSTTLYAGQSAIITATVTDGKPTPDPVVGAKVTFRVLNNSDATIVAVNGGITDASGKASALYTAGKSTPTLEINETIKASVADASSILIVTRTGILDDQIDEITASSTTVSEGDISIITAKIAHKGVYGEISSQTITFSIPINNSGASLIDGNGDHYSSITIPVNLPWNTSLEVSVAYQAGTSISEEEVQDVVRASLSNGYGLAVIITRSAETASP
jgi:hypothetical protein